MPPAHFYQKNAHISDTERPELRSRERRKNETYSSRSDRNSSSVVRSVTGDELPVTDVVMPASLVVTSAAVASAVSAKPSCGCKGAFFLRASTRVQRSSCASSASAATDAEADAFLPFPTTPSVDVAMD